MWLGGERRVRNQTVAFTGGVGGSSPHGCDESDKSTKYLFQFIFIKVINLGATGLVLLG